MIRWIGIGCVSGLAWLGTGSGAVAADYPVSATNSDTFLPSTVTIVQGDTVTWTNEGGSHNVKFDDGSFTEPSSPQVPPWTVSRTFTTPGTFGYYCEAHGAPGGMGMSGTVVVQAPPGGGGGGGGGPPPPVADTAPTASLAGPSRQRIGKLFVRASMNEAGTVTATGSVSVPGAAKLYRLRPARKTVAANQSVKLRLKLRSKALRAVNRALRKGKRLKARITVSARDLTGHQTVRRRTIRLKR